MHFLKSLVFSVFSPKFYRESVRKGGGKAFGVFVLFLILVTLGYFVYFAFNFGIDLYRIPQEMEDFPQITVTDAGLSVTGLEMPYEYVDDNTYFAVDTTGVITTIPEQYSEGFLLTDTEIIVRSTEYPQDQIVTYDQVLETLDRETLEINEETVATFIQGFGVIIILLSPIAIFLWLFVSKIFAVFVISILGLIVLSIMKKEQPFSKSFTIALYNTIPVVYLNVFFSIVKWLFRIILQEMGVDTTSLMPNVCCLSCFIPILLNIGKWGIFFGIGAYGLSKDSN